MDEYAHGLFQSQDALKGNEVIHWASHMFVCSTHSQIGRVTLSHWCQTLALSGQ